MRAELKYFGVLSIVTWKLYYSASEPIFSDFGLTSESARI